MARMGRPKTEKPMSDRLYIRITKEEKEEIHKFCKEHGYTFLELIREGMKAVKNKK